LRRRTLRELAYLLKRNDRRDEAFAFWQQLAVEPGHHVEGVLAHVELAKYLEWYVEDLSRAADWTRAALERINDWSPGKRRDERRADLRHRLSRLERKMGQERPPNSGPAS
jgi:hypothetical protein